MRVSAYKAWNNNFPAAIDHLIGFAGAYDSDTRNSTVLNQHVRIGENLLPGIHRDDGRVFEESFHRKLFGGIVTAEELFLCQGSSENP